MKSEIRDIPMFLKSAQESGKYSLGASLTHEKFCYPFGCNNLIVVAGRYIFMCQRLPAIDVIYAFNNNGCQYAIKTDDRDRQVEEKDGILTKDAFYEK